jgi:hypothetical protein
MAKRKRVHTPIITEAQRRFFGAELGRLREGKSTVTGMSEKKLRSHIKEVSGKRLPEKRRTKEALARSRELRRQFKKKRIKK